MTVDTIEVSDTLTIGGAPSLGQDAIDKLQAQIINPTQDIYIDQKNGDDDNDGKSVEKAFRTLDKAISSIISYTKRVSFHFCIHHDVNDLHYNRFVATKTINISSVETFVFTRYTDVFPVYTDTVLPEIVVPYGSISVGTYAPSGKPWKAWGYYLMNGATNIECQYVRFSFPEEASEDENIMVNAIFWNVQGSFSIDNGDVYESTEPFFTASTNKYLFNFITANSVELIRFYRCKIAGNTLLMHGKYPKKLYSNDPITTETEENEVNNSSFGNGALITKYIKQNATVDSGVLGSTYGLSENSHAIYIQGFS